MPICDDDRAPLAVLDSPNLRREILRASSPVLRGTGFHNNRSPWKRPLLYSMITEALHLGYYHALMRRFLSEQGIDAEPWLRARRQVDPRPANPRDRTHDYKIALEHFPELDSYVPTTPLTKKEIVHASRDWLYVIIRGPGSEEQQARRTKCTTYKHKYWGTPPPALEPHVNFRPFADGGAMSPLVLEAARHLVPQYGLVPALYWIWNKVICEDTTELLRMFGADTWDETSLETTRKDLRRKLEVMDAEVKDLLGSLLPFRVAYEMMGTN